MKLSLAFILCTVPAALFGGPIFEITDLGALGGTTSAGHRINDQGQTVGSATDMWGNQHATSGGTTMSSIGRNAAAWDVNSSGRIVGVQYVNGRSYAATWDASGMQFLAGTGVGSAALGINDLGQITGMTGNGRAFLTDVNGGIRDMGVLIGGDWAAGRAINEFGQVAGYGTKGSSFRAFRWNEGSGYTELGTLGGRNSYGMDINDNGVVVGHAQNSSGYLRASIWTDTRAVELGTLGGRNSYGYGINKNGSVVGYSQVANGEVHAFLYQDGVLYDLNDLLANNTGWELRYAYGINNEGQIVGEGMYQGQMRAFRLDPRKLLSRLSSLTGGGSGGFGGESGGGDGEEGEEGGSGGGPVGFSTFSVETGATAVPEPSSWALGLAGLAMVALGRARRR